MHLMANLELDVDAPYPKPEVEEIFKKPEPLSYNNDPLQFKQYGKNIEKIIKKAIDYEDEEMKKLLVKVIANHLKKLYLNWNRESVNDNLINEHLKKLSDGKLEIPEGLELNSTSDILARVRKKKTTKTDQKTRPRRRYNNHK
jgi:hypothetical protein